MFIKFLRATTVRLFSNTQLPHLVPVENWNVAFLSQAFETKVLSNGWHWMFGNLVSKKKMDFIQFCLFHSTIFYSNLRFKCFVVRIRLHRMLNYNLNVEFGSDEKRHRDGKLGGGGGGLDQGMVGVKSWFNRVCIHRAKLPLYNFVTKVTKLQITSYKVDEIEKSQYEILQALVSQSWNCLIMSKLYDTAIRIDYHISVFPVVTFISLGWSKCEGTHFERK